jgi:hypothetical protein
MISAIPVNKGLYIHISISGYNRFSETYLANEPSLTSPVDHTRLPDVWGPDAHEFVPERWLEGANWKIVSPFGVYSNL